MFANYYANIEELCLYVRVRKYWLAHKSLIYRRILKERAGEREHAD